MVNGKWQMANGKWQIIINEYTICGVYQVDIPTSEFSDYKKLIINSFANRVVITLRDLQGLSSREVSQVLKCSEATVRVHLFNARRQLKKALRPLISEQEQTTDVRGCPL